MSSTDAGHLPAASAPPGYTSNLQHHVTKDTSAGVILATLGMVIATFFLIMRIYTKAILARIFGIDDIAIILAWAGSLVTQITIVYYMCVKIIGTHTWDMSLNDLKKIVLITAIDSVIYLAVMALAKFSILLFYLRLSREKWFTYAIYGTMLVVLGFSVSLMMALIFACTPLKKVWDVTVTEGHCINRGQIYLATAGLNAATDIIMLILPMPMLRKLQVPMRQKIGLMFIFSIGSMTMITSIVRLSLMPPLVTATDLPWDLATPSTWICIEGNLVIITGCLPVLRLFFRHVAPRLIGEYGTYGSGRGTGASIQKPTIGSSELSNLSRSKRSARQHSDFDTVRTEMGPDDGSETHIMELCDKNGVETEVNDLGIGASRSAST